MVVRLATEEVADGQYASDRQGAALDELALRPGSFEPQVLDLSVSSEARKRAADGSPAVAAAAASAAAARRRSG